MKTAQGRHSREAWKRRRNPVEGVEMLKLTEKAFRAREAEALKNPVRGAEAELGINESIRERLFTHLNSLRSVWTARQDQAKKSAGWMPRH